MHRAARVLAVVAGLIGLAPWGAASAGPSVSPVADASAWLERLHDAALGKNYQGTLAVSAGGEVSSSRVAHYCEGPHQYERIESLDGPPRLVFRHNGLVHTVWPQARVVVVEQRDQNAALPSLLRARPDPRLFEHYTPRFKGDERVAGLDAQVVLLEPRDALRYAQKLWSERKSGLLLRADMIDADGRVLESAAFTEVAIGVRPRPDVVLAAMKKTDGYRVVRPEIAAADLDREGWLLGDVPAGFRPVSSVRRMADDNGGSSRSDMLQAVYSDGLTHVSIFIEAHKPGRHQPGRMATGATHTLMQQRDQWWITVVGDVPAATLARFAGALQRRR